MNQKISAFCISKKSIKLSIGCDKNENFIFQNNGVKSIDNSFYLDVCKTSCSSSILDKLSKTINVNCPLKVYKHGKKCVGTCKQKLFFEFRMPSTEINFVCKGMWFIEITEGTKKYYRKLNSTSLECKCNIIYL